MRMSYNLSSIFISKIVSQWNNFYSIITT